MTAKRADLALEGHNMTFCYSTEPIEVADWRALEPHDMCAVFPRLPDEERELLRQSIIGNGMRFPIVLFEGKILDGRQRFEICRDEDVEPRFETFMGPGSAMAFVIDVNVRRRHLTQDETRSLLADLSKIAGLRQQAREKMTR
jgi:hypothetical protein